MASTNALRKDWITVDEAASILGLSRRRTLELIADGRIAAHRLPNCWLVDAASARKAATIERPPGRPKSA